MKKVVNRYLQGGFYSLAGILHFIMPEFYHGLIPDWLPAHGVINIMAGISEVILGVWLLSGKLPRLSAMFGTAMLIAFIPSHIYFIQIGSCLPGESGLCVPEWIAWVRLVIIHPVLILWLWAKRTVQQAK
ncbi:MAG: DoxX family protein [Candidatus Kapaibacteriales bacterium]